MIKQIRYSTRKAFNQLIATRNYCFWGLILVLSCISIRLQGQNAIPENKYIHFEGNIGEKKNMVLDLHKFGDSIFGSYYSLINGQPHYFVGKTFHSVRFWATEKNGDSINGEFISNKIISGYMSNNKGASKKTFMFAETDYFGSMTFEASSYSRTYAFSDKPLYPPYKVDLHYLYPVENINQPVEDSVQDYIIGYYFGKNVTFSSTGEMLKLLSDNCYQSYFKHYKTNAFDYRSSLLKWSNFQDIQILFNENFILVFCIKQTTSNWEKETLWDKIYFVINLKTGNRIYPDNIFISGYNDKLKKLLTDKLQVQFNITTSLQNEGFYKSQVKRYDNLYVNREGIGFHYNPGEIAPTIFGEIDISLTFDELKEILNPKGIVFTLVPGY
jgi:hypothetical protein